MRGEQSARGKGDVLAALAATEPQRTVGAAALIGVQATALRANRSAVSLSPTDRAELAFGLEIRETEYGGEAQGLGGAGEKEVLRYRTPYRSYDVIRMVRLDWGQHKSMALR